MCVLSLVLFISFLFSKQELPIEKQISVLEKARSKKIWSGLCFKISDALKEELGEYVYITEIKKYIPSFTKMNCIRLSKKYNFI